MRRVTVLALFVGLRVVSLAGTPVAAGRVGCGALAAQDPTTPTQAVVDRLAAVPGVEGVESVETATEVCDEIRSLLDDGDAGAIDDANDCEA
jgi:hypothetical protein